MGRAKKVAYAVAVAGMVPTGLAATAKPSGASVLDTKFSWEAARWSIPSESQIGLDVNRKCSLSVSLSHSYAEADHHGSTNYGIRESLKPVTPTVVDWSKGNFENQEMWEDTGTTTWIEAGFTIGDEYYLPSHFHANHLYVGLYWADQRSSSTYYSHNFTSATDNTADLYKIDIVPKGSNKSWKIAWEASKSSRVLSSGFAYGTHENHEDGSGASFGIENTCKSNGWPVNDQRFGRKVANSGHYSWTTFSNMMGKKKSGTDVVFNWITQGQKFSAGT